MYTMRDAVQERQQADAAFNARCDKRAAKEARIAEAFFVPADMHPAIGIFVTAKGVRFYIMVNRKCIEGTVELLTAILTKGE